LSTTYKSLDIQALRGISLIGVLLYHSFSNHFPGGYLGVDVFFVISGFVITPLLLKTFGDQRLSSWGKFKDFLTKRFFRLVPALIVSILTSGVLLYVFSPLEDHIRIARQGISSLFMMGNVGAVFFSGNYFSPNPNPFIHTWSLGVESQIYLFMPICFLFLSSWRYSFEKIVLRFLTVITILSVILFFISINLSAQEIFSEFSYYSPITRVWQFSIGGIAFIVASKKRRSTQKIWVYHFLLSVLFLIFLFPVGSNILIASIVTTFISGTILVLQSLLTLPKFLLNPLCWLGNRSYSIYLYHMPFIYLAKFSPVLKSEYQEVKTVLVFLSVVISILIVSIS
jgi:peptidoglycan/LPS O-acetylase OafA/YrhL